MTETDIAVFREGAEGLSMGSYADALRERLPDRAVTLARMPKQKRELVVDTRVITGITMDRDLLNHADRLELFTRTFVGTDHVPMGTLADHGVVVTNAGGIHALGIAEQAIGSILVFARRLHEGWRHERRTEWRHFQSGEFVDNTVAIIGLGLIGQAVAQHLQSFEVETVDIYYTPSKGGPTDEITDFDPDAIHDALSRSDYAVVACPLNGLTRRLIGDTEFATMPADTVLVNATHGGIVNTGALVSVLRSNKIRGAVLDVADPKPLPADHPLWGLENCPITPHAGGHTPKHWDHLADIAVGNLERLDEGEELENQVLTTESN